MVVALGAEGADLGAMMNQEEVETVALVVVVVLLIVFTPLATIWALNTLFVLTIPYSLETWTAALVLAGLIYSHGSSK